MEVVTTAFTEMYGIEQLVVNGVFNHASEMCICLYYEPLLHKVSVLPDLHRKKKSTNKEKHKKTLKQPNALSYNTKSVIYLISNTDHFINSIKCLAL